MASCVEELALRELGDTVEEVGDPLRVSCERVWRGSVKALAPGGAEAVWALGLAVGHMRNGVAKAMAAATLLCQAIKSIGLTPIQACPDPPWRTRGVLQGLWKLLEVPWGSTVF